MEQIKTYFQQLSTFDKLIWGCAALLVLKWLMGPSSTVTGGTPTVQFIMTGGVELWGILLYAAAFLVIRLGYVAKYISEKKALWVLMGVYGFAILMIAFVIEKRGAHVQFLLSIAFVGLQIYAYRRRNLP